MKALEVKNYSYTYTKNDGSEKKALHDLCFSIEKGTITGILGLSGSGKTTLCKALCGIIPHCYPGPFSGTILVNGIDTAETPLNRLSREIGFVMQNPDEQLVTATLEDEFAFALENLAIPPAEIRKKVDEMIMLLGFDGMKLSDPNRLSGGQKQLAALGSVLILDPEILVLDEPMSHLDEEGKELLRDTLISLRSREKTVIMVGHDPKNMRFADMWLLLSEGRIDSFDPPAEIMKQFNGFSDGAWAEILGIKQ